ncbi:hypothetical protein AHF37_12563 [Paragonimus kellicotti]|nr:hypothetical protein AHF37_12563 [Paragonimus kellicotti]
MSKATATTLPNEPPSEPCLQEDAALSLLALRRMALHALLPLQATPLSTLQKGGPQGRLLSVTHVGQSTRNQQKTVGSLCSRFPLISSGTELFASAFVQTMLTAQFMETLDYYPGASTQCTPRSHASHNMPLIFLSFVDAQLPHTPSPISNRLRSLPGAFSTIVRLLLKRSCADPPPNCSSHVYHLMGREDLARLCELTKVTDLPINNSGFPACTKSPSESVNNAPAESLTELPMYNTRLSHAPWSLAERWANSVRPLREPTPSSSLQSTVDERLGQNSLLTRHSLLCQLENNPSCQAAFRVSLFSHFSPSLLQSAI